MMNLENIENISSVITFYANKTPNNIVVVLPKREITYERLENTIIKTTYFLVKKGLKEGDVVVIKSSNEYFVLIMMLSIARIGATTITIPSSTSKYLFEEIRSKIKAKFLFSEENIDLEKLEKSELFENNILIVEKPKSPYMLVLGSGSTGKKKLMPITHTQELYKMKISIQWLEATVKDRVGTFVNINFSIAKSIYLETFYVGGTIILFNKRDTLQSIYLKYKPTILHATVFHIKQFLDKLVTNTTYKLPLLKKLYVGGSLVSDYIRNQIVKKITPNLSVRYGINEVGTIAKVDYSINTQLSSVGKPLSGLEVQIVDSEDNILPKKTVGEIRIKSKGQIDSYLNDEQSTKIAFKDAWFYTNDLGKFTEDGELVHMGRADLMMIKNGINIYPIEIEQAMIKHKAVEDVAVMPVKSIFKQDIPVCAVVLNKEHKINENQLLRYSFEELGSSAPMRIVIIDNIPKNEQGKIQRIELKRKINMKLNTLKIIKWNYFYGANIYSKSSIITCQVSNIIYDFEILKKFMDIFPECFNKKDYSDIKEEELIGILLSTLAKYFINKYNACIEECGSRVENKNNIFWLGFYHLDVTKYAIRLVIGFFNKFLANNEIEISSFSLKPLEQLCSKYYTSSSQLIELAQRNSLPILYHLDKSASWQFGYGKNSRVFYHASSYEDSYHGVRVSLDKNESKKLLTIAGFPIAKSIVIKSISELRYAEMKIGYPCVVKPIRGAQAKGITVNIETYKELLEAYKYAKKSAFGKNPIMIEEFVKGDEHRLFVANGKLLAVGKKIPSYIIGDGKSTINILIDNLNTVRKNPNKNPIGFKEIKIDKYLMKYLLKKELNLNDIIEKDKKINLSEYGSLSQGGIPIDITGDVHTHIKLMAEQIAEITGIATMGIDFISTDITKSFKDNKSIITEFNHLPGLLFFDYIKNSNKIFLDTLNIGNGRIQIDVIISNKNMIKKIDDYYLDKELDICTGWVSNEKIYLGQLPLEIKKFSGWENVNMLLRHKKLERLLIICTDDDILIKGLPVNTIDNIYTYEENLKKDWKELISNYSNKVFEFDTIENLLETGLKRLNNQPINEKKSYDLFLNEKVFSLKIDKKSIPYNFDILDKWLKDILKINIIEHKKTNILVNKICYRILSLATTLFQSINIPIFSVGKIHKMYYDHKLKVYSIDITLDFINNIPDNVYKIILDRSIKIVIEYLNKDITDSNIQRLYRYIQNHVINLYKRVSGSGKSTIPILKEAYTLNIPYKHFGSGVYQLGWGSKSKLMDRSTTGFDSAIGAKMAQSKMITSNLVREAGFPAPQNELVSTKINALKEAHKLGFPVVVKPSDQDRGEGITIGIRNKEDLYKAFDIAKKSSCSKKVIIEKQVDGICHRIFISNGKLLYAVKRLPKGIFADGKNSIKELINSANYKEKKLPPWLKSEPYPLDKMTMLCLEEQGLKITDIPRENEFISLRDIESTRWGGTDEDVTQTIDQENIDIAISSARLFGLHVAGIDIISSDIAKPWYENNAIINEVNFSPLFGGGEISKKAIPKFLKEFISGDGRIPIYYFKQEFIEKAKELQNKKQKEGISCFLIESCKEQEKKVKAMLLNTTVDELIILE